MDYGTILHLIYPLSKTGSQQTSEEEMLARLVIMELKKKNISRVFEQNYYIF